MNRENRWTAPCDDEQRLEHETLDEAIEAYLDQCEGQTPRMVKFTEWALRYIEHASVWAYEPVRDGEIDVFAWMQENEPGWLSDIEEEEP